MSLLHNQLRFAGQGHSHTSTSISIQSRLAAQLYKTSRLLCAHIREIPSSSMFAAAALFFDFRTPYKTYVHQVIPPYLTYLSLVLSEHNTRRSS